MSVTEESGSLDEPNRGSRDPFSALAPGRLLGGGRYFLQSPLHPGSTLSWVALDNQTGAEVVLRLPPAALLADPTALNHLLETARSCFPLVHPNILRLLDTHQSPGEPVFLVTEYVVGPDLEKLRLGQPSEHFPWELLEPLFAQACAALAYAHAQGFVHGNIRPSNMFVNRAGELKLAPFGLPHLSWELADLPATDGAGALSFLTPQILDGAAPTASDDIYALGATFYQLLTGTLPFHIGDIAHQVRAMRPQSIVERLAELGMDQPVPQPVIAAITACLARNPDDRPESADHLWRLIDPHPQAELQPQVASSHEPISLIPPEPAPQKSALPMTPLEEAEAFQKSLPRSAAQPLPEESVFAGQGPWRKVLALSVGITLVAAAYWWGTQQTDHKPIGQAQAAAPSSFLASNREPASTLAPGTVVPRSDGIYVGEGPSFNYRYSPREAGALDTNAINQAVRFFREAEDRGGCAYLIGPTGTNNPVGTITYELHSAPGFLIEDLQLAQHASVFTSGRIRGVYSLDGGKTFEEFFLTPPYVGRTYGYGRTAHLWSLNASNVLVRYIIHRYGGYDYNLQFLRDCQDAPALLEISGSVIPSSEARLVQEIFATPDLSRDLRVVTVEDGPFTLLEQQQTNVWVMPRKAKPHYLYFDISDELRPRDGAEVRVELEYLDTGYGEIILHYDSSDVSLGREAAYKAHPDSVARRNTGQWQKARFVMADARLTGGQNERADFRFYANGDDLLVRRAEVRGLYAADDFR